MSDDVLGTRDIQLFLIRVISEIIEFNVSSFCFLANRCCFKANQSM